MYNKYQKYELCGGSYLNNIDKLYNNINKLKNKIYKLSIRIRCKTRKHLLFH